MAERERDRSQERFGGTAEYRGRFTLFTEQEIIDWVKVQAEKVGGYSGGNFMGRLLNIIATYRRRTEELGMNEMRALMLLATDVHSLFEDEGFEPLPVEHRRAVWLRSEFDEFRSD